MFSQGANKMIKSANTRNRGRVEIMGGGDRCFFFFNAVRP